MAVLGGLKDLIEQYPTNSSEVAKKISKFKNPLYVYLFPMTLISDLNYPVHDVQYDTDDNLPFIQLKSVGWLSDREAFKKLFVSLSVMSLYLDKGVNTRPIEGIGGFCKEIVDESYQPVIHKPKVNNLIKILEKCEDPFQIQAGFTLSRAYSSFQDSETAIIEFFKIIELYIKFNAYNGKLSTASFEAVKRFNLFDNSVKTDLVNILGLKDTTVELIWDIKDLRNKVIGHGGVRPYLSAHVRDPEGHHTTIARVIRNYDPLIKFDEGFYEIIKYDSAVLARLLFGKMCDFKPINLLAPGCWWQPTQRVQSMAKYEGMKDHIIDFDILKPSRSK